jgi:hypothetical protein
MQQKLDSKYLNILKEPKEIMLKELMFKDNA